MPHPCDSLWSAFGPLAPLMLVVFVGFFPMGMAFPVVPRHVLDALGQGPVVVGVVMGSQFGSALFARMWAGAVADGRGPRLAASAGLLGVACVGGVYFLSLAWLQQPLASLGVLIAARLLTGVAESFVITALLSWGIARVGPEHAGKVIGWVGMALFGAYAAGAPAGVAVHGRFGFGGIAAATVLVPLVALAIALAVAPVHPHGAQRPPWLHVVGAVKWPGLGLTLSSSGYAMVSAFVTLLFAQQGWDGAAYAFTALGAGFIVARLAFGQLPDRLGGARVALGCVVVEALGLGMLWLAPVPALAWLGSALAGGGYALAFQGFGVEAVRRTPPQSRGAAMGAYVAFQDVAMLLSAPLGGLLGRAAGIDAVYLAAAVAALASAGVAWAMDHRTR